MYNIDEYISEMAAEKKFNARIDFDLAHSQAVLALMKLQKARLLPQFLKDEVIGADKEMKGYELLQNHFTHSLYGYESERFLSFSNKVIFILRTVFEPCSWFYGVEEELPPPIPFTANPERSAKDLFIDDTVGKILFRSLAKNFKTYNMFAETYKLPYANIKNMLTKFKYTYKGVNIIKYKTFATESIIKALRNTIHPDYWYIFPEELSPKDQYYKFVRKWLSIQQDEQDLKSLSPYTNK